MRLAGATDFFRTALRANVNHALYIALDQMTADRAMDTSVDDGDPTLGRESGIMEIVEREASPVAGAVEPEKTRDDDIEIDTELERPGALKPPRVASPKLQAGSPHVAIVDDVVVEDDSIELTDDEIESSDPLPARPSLPSPSSAGVLRSRPPIRPSVRPRAPNSNSLLPPPQRPSLAAPGFGPTSNFPGSSRLDCRRSSRRRSRRNRRSSRRRRQSSQAELAEGGVAAGVSRCRHTRPDGCSPAARSRSTSAN